ncbi:transcriptional regulatory protein YpdB [Desulfosporosinus acididurans]|uniref:Stage 0 sporulation protein A homolog n=1 Tax=Desulfosporosinus acididurans TaxID=476652 RepID=A0A0J1FQA3_9FIRM|nr:LytTR family DNA-binding domain-containing protein [Desulfosporosinus acididurans]KLU65148.1 transcriptional regulatory protein YpdB [Desulfosporosinus acididurans]
METDKTIKLIIAEDNQPTRELIESYLSIFPEVQVIGSVSNGEEILALVEKNIPTVIFLDVEMPGLNGLVAAARIRELLPNVFIIFVTAHAQYAAEAFQLEATDYLIKPISKESIERAIKRVKKYLDYSNIQNNNNKALKELLVLKNKSETYLIRPETIFYIEKVIKKTIVHTENGEYDTSETLNSLQKRLKGNFFRCHRGFIVNIQKIERIVPIAERIYNVYFYNCPHHATMIRKKLDELYEMMNLSSEVNKY